jgi:hypothetical protein
MRKVIAKILIRLAAHLLARDSDRKNARHIRATVRVADFPAEIADVLIERGVTPHEADVLFRDCLRRPEC